MKSKFPFWLIALIFLIKVVLIYWMKGPFIYPDEGCIVMIAKHFSETGEIVKCTNITNITGGDPFPLYSILVSVVYKTLGNEYLYQGILVLNTILVTSLAYPLYKLAKLFKLNHSSSVLIAALALFFPQIIAFEKSLMTETLFTFLNIWFLYFYIFSINEKSLNKKLIAILIAVLAYFTRPFGFIVLLGMVANEFFLNRKKKIVIVFGVLTIALVSFAVFSNEARITDLTNKINQGFLKDPLIAIQTFVQQVNSFSVPVFIIPLMIFIRSLFEKDKGINKIRCYLITIITLSFIITWQHQIGYALNDATLSLLTRYINVPLILVLFFGLIFIIRGEFLKFDKKNLYIAIFLGVFLIFYDQSNIRSPLNTELTHLAEVPQALTYYLLPILMMLIPIFFLQDKRKLIIVLSTLILTNSMLLQLSVRNVSLLSAAPYNGFTEDLKSLTKSKILYLQIDKRLNPGSEFWAINMFTDHKIDLVFYGINPHSTHKYLDDANRPKFVSFKDLLFFVANGTPLSSKVNFANYDKVISSIPIPLPLESVSFNGQKMYKIIPADTNAKN